MAGTKAARIASNKTAIAADVLSRRVCACGCGNRIPLKNLLTVRTSMPTVTRAHNVYYIKEHYK